MIRYFVSYVCHGMPKFGWEIVDWPTPIATEDDLLKITEEITDRIGRGVTILGWQPLAEQAGR